MARGSIRLHLGRERPLAAQGVVNEVADGGPVAGACEPVALAPIGQRDRCGAMPLEHLVEHLDGGLDVRAWPHGVRLRPAVITCSSELDPHAAR